MNTLILNLMTSLKMHIISNSKNFNLKTITRISLIAFVLFSSCRKDQEDPAPQPELSAYELEVIDYFKDIALGFEFGSVSQITRKWESEMKIFIGGRPSTELLTEVEKIKTEINDLATDGFEISITKDSVASNYYLFLGDAQSYVKIFPSSENLVSSNWGLFSVFWHSGSILDSGHMYVDVERANLQEQKHLLREELTQSLGLAMDSPLYNESIFQSAWTTTTEYASIDKDLIRLLYHPDMQRDLNAEQVDQLLREILLSE